MMFVSDRNQCISHLNQIKDQGFAYQDNLVYLSFYNLPMYDIPLSTIVSYDDLDKALTDYALLPRFSKSLEKYKFKRLREDRFKNFIKKICYLK